MGGIKLGMTSFCDVSLLCTHCFSSLLVNVIDKGQHLSLLAVGPFSSVGFLSQLACYRVMSQKRCW